MVDKQAQSQFVRPVAFGERERFSHETTQTLAQGVVPTLDVAGFARAFATQAMIAPRKGLVISQKLLRVARRRYAGGMRLRNTRAAAAKRSPTR